MLRQLHISNLAIIEDAAVEFSPGLNCFTGQTGAGKSLILGALEILLGLRSGPIADMLRPGSDQARITALFEILDPTSAAQLSQAADLTIAPGDDLLITKKIFASGRSTLTINGQPAATGMARQIAEILIDIHGQHDHQFLLKPANQLLMLDRFGSSTDQRDQFNHTYSRWRDLTNQLTELSASSSLRTQQLDLYEFQFNQIDAAQPQPDQYNELRTRHTLLSNLQRLKQDAAATHAALYDSEGAIVERAQMAAHVLIDLAELDPALKPIAEQVRAATLSLQEASFDLGRYADRLDLDPAELARIEDRLNTLNRLVSRYADHAASLPNPAQPGDDPIAPVLAYRHWLEKQITGLRNQTHDLSRLQEEIRNLQAQAVTLAHTLSRARRNAAQKIKPLVENELHELGMPQAQLEIDFNNLEPGATDLALASTTGFDTVEFMVRLNPGQPARPLRKTASGGELSRIMLALKAILAQSDRISVLVFDEIDANIGGRMGAVIGQKLAKLALAPAGKKSDQRRRQILCITHLPQIAAFADRHLRIAKSVAGKGKDKQTTTTVTALQDQARIDELAEMLAGKDATQTTRKQAAELLHAASA